jgi:transposase
MMEADNAIMSTAGTEFDTSTHTTDRMSARKQRIELIMRGERRRHWSLEQKQAIVAESLAPNASLMTIAQQHGIGTGLLYAWRHQLLGKQPAGAACFARVDIPNGPRRLAGPVATPSARSSGLIEIVLPDGTSVRVDAQVDDGALRRVLGVLRG